MKQKRARLKGVEDVIMTVFWIVFAVAAAAVFFLVAILIYTHLLGARVS